MAHTLYELDVRLRHIEPAIWRTIEVPGAATFEQLHAAIQIAMGWTNSHLHQFAIERARYGMVDGEGAEDRELEDERQFRLQDLVHDGDTFLYEYDFGDGWEHEIKVKKITSHAKPPKPRCTAGARACPPEDCGGPGGYADLIVALREPKNPKHASLVEWADGFQPERFPIPKAGFDLQRPMDELIALANEGDARGDGPFDGDEDDTFGLPKPLIDAVLAMEPMQRAALSALISRSLAVDLIEAISFSTQVATALKQSHTPARHARRRAR